MASLVEVKRENERVRWLGEVSARIYQRTVTERCNQRQMYIPTVYSTLCAPPLCLREISIHLQ